MRYLFIAFLFVSLFGHSQGIEPSSFQGNPNKGGFLKGITLNVDDFGDTTYLYVHVDSTALADSIYLRGDSLILLKNGSGQVYKARIYDYNQTSVYYYDIPNPQKWDIYVDDQYDSSGKNRYYDGSSWQIFDYDGYVGNEGRLYVLDGTSYNTARIRSYHGDYTYAVLKGDSLVKVNSVFDSNILDITLDTVNLLDLTTQYLNPYIMGPDTVGFYLTIAQDTVLFVATADTTAGTVDIVTGTSPIIITGDATHTPNVTIQNATTSQSGALTSTDWNTFNNKFNLPSLTNGSILFSNGTTIAQDNANLFWDDTNNELEIKSIPIGSNATDQLYAGVSAGSSATNAYSSNFFGTSAGSSATNAYSSNFFGLNAGNGATGANSSNFFGLNAGNGATGANSSNFFGNSAGSGAISAGASNFFGLNAGNGATVANSSNFFGNSAGSGATGGSYSNFFGFNAGKTFSGNNLGTNNIIIGTNISLPNSTVNSLNIGGVLFGTGLQSSVLFNPKIVATSGGKIGVMTVTPAQTLHVTGTTRITGSDGTSTTIMGRDADGDVSAITHSYGLNLASNLLKVDTSATGLATAYDITQLGDITAVTVTAPLTGGGPSGSVNIGLDTTSATGVATQYDLTQVVGSSKVIDILGSDYTTSATSLQSTALTYTFPSTGTYEIKIYGSYTCSNTANGINVGFIDSGGLVASYITGKHSAFTNNTSSSSTETRKPISAIGTTLSTASVGASSTQYTVMSEALITVSTAGTITVGFASGSGSYSATLQAGSSLIIEKLN